jgi:hypothetical protein
LRDTFLRDIKSSPSAPRPVFIEASDASLP